MMVVRDRIRPNKRTRSSRLRGPDIRAVAPRARALPLRAKVLTLFASISAPKLSFRIRPDHAIGLALPTRHSKMRESAVTAGFGRSLSVNMQRDG
jgi:hypothetical protein